MNKFEKYCLYGLITCAVCAVCVPAISVPAGLAMVPFLACFGLSQCAPAENTNNE